MMTFNRGEPIEIDLVDNDGAYTGQIPVAKIKEADSGKPPPQSAAPKATPTVTYYAAVGQDAGYWRFKVEDTTNWKPGIYVMDAKFPGGRVTDAVPFRLQESVTP